MKKSDGFTLIELLIAVAIVGILASIAVPSYQDSVRKSRRADAKGALMGFANAMERHFTENNNYCDVGGGGGGDTCPAGVGDSTVNDTGSPPINGVFSSVSPVDGGAVYYNLTISAASETSFTLSATPTGAQTGDKCGTLTLQSTGVRGVSSSTVADCW